MPSHKLPTGWLDSSTAMALLTILLWSTLATLTSRITSVSPLVLVGLVLFFCGLGAVPFWRQREHPWRDGRTAASPDSPPATAKSR